MDLEKLKMGNQFQENIKLYERLQELFVRNEDENKIDFLCDFFKNMTNICDTSLKRELAEKVYKFLVKEIDIELKKYQTAFDKL